MDDLMGAFTSRGGPSSHSTGSARLLYGLVGAAAGLTSALSFLVVQALLSSMAQRPRGLARADELSAYLVYTALLTVLVALLGQHLGRQEDELRRLTSIDDLTGLFNRRHVEARLVQELDRARRYAYPFSLALLDVDELKLINDSLGHRAGDEALRRVADALAAHVRSADLAARFGGDEFVLLLPHTSVSEAEALAHRVRRAVGVTAPGDPYRVTVSIGLAGFVPPGNGPSPRELLDAADRALLRAKREGRDGVGLEPDARPSISRMSRGHIQPPRTALQD